MTAYEQIYRRDNCSGCKHCQAGRWQGWSCRAGVPGNDDKDYSCKTPDPDQLFWVVRESLDRNCTDVPDA